MCAVDARGADQEPPALGELVRRLGRLDSRSGSTRIAIQLYFLYTVPSQIVP